tara:strand:+ start:3913 stop:4527 length:615 start_codon:yes stop_codon:yes gene_type:complete
MKYITEGNINFFDEVNKKDDINVIDTECCLIENKPLTENYITLNCNHKFNYVPIFNEIIKQKTVYNPNEITKLKNYQIKCPYCRQITNNLIPFIPCIPSSKKINGVTIPNIFCFNHKNCSWKFKSGKNKGKLCNCNGFDSKYGPLCEKHWNMKQKKYTDIKLTTEMKDLYDKHTVKELRNMLKIRNLTCSGNKKDLVVKIIQNM